MAAHSYNVLQGLTFAQYVVEPFFPDCEKPKMAINLLAVVSISKIYYYQIIQCLKNKNNNMHYCENFLVFSARISPFLNEHW